MEITKENYSPWTLNLRSETEKTKFWKYRCDDVREQFTYITVIVCMINVRAWIEFLNKRDSPTFTFAVDGAFSSILHVTLWFNRKKAKNKFALCVLLLLLINNVQRVVSSFVQLRLSESDDI